MSVTIQELESIANSALDYYLKKDGVLSQAIQDKPLLNAMKSRQKMFPGGKGDIRGNVKGTYTTTFMGYSDDDTVNYVRPGNVKQFVVPWKELHAGIEVTFTDLKKDGISVTDSVTGETTTPSERDMTVISGIFEDKLEDMTEGTTQSFNEILWRDGTQSAKVPAGIQSIITTSPSSGVKEGIDAAANAWWRNRALTDGNKITASASNQTLTKTLRQEVRQLRRYSGRPSLVLAGSTFIDALELEVHEKGTYTQEGFTKAGATDIGMADIRMRGVGAFVYDPTLDDLGYANYCYMIDPRHLKLHTMEGEDMVRHSPARPAKQYLIYRGVTYTGALVANKLNCHGVYQVADL